MKPRIIFFGNGKLAEAALKVLAEACEIVFHARTKEDLVRVKEIMGGGDGVFGGCDSISAGDGGAAGGAGDGKKIYGVLASYGQILREDVMSLFEPEGILNIHPSLLPKYRGAAPIEAAILDGEREFGVSVMKIVKEMDAGPVYWQEKVNFSDDLGGAADFGDSDSFGDSDGVRDDGKNEDWIDKFEIYDVLGRAGAEFIVKMLNGLENGEKFVAVEQEGEPSFTQKFDTGMAKMDFSSKSAEILVREVQAFARFPKSRMEIFGKDCIVTRVRVVNLDGGGEGGYDSQKEEMGVFVREKRLFVRCFDGSVLELLRLQPAGKREMEARAFLNGYGK